MMKGVFAAKKADGTQYYRCAICYKNKRISLGSFEDEKTAGFAYEEAADILFSDIGAEMYEKSSPLALGKWITLINFRDNGLYFKTPIYLRKKYFEYYLDEDFVLKFDADDLFYFSHHTIMKRGGHYFVADYGMQVNILNRFGIKNFAVCGRDYRFVNGDPTDFRRVNLDIINHYNGVTRTDAGIYTAKIHINGDFIIGRYHEETDAAIAYNKAADLLAEKGSRINYQKNYIDGISSIQYAARYNSIKISKKIREL